MFRFRTLENPKAPVYIDGKLDSVLKGGHIAVEFKHILSENIISKYYT